MAPSIPAEVLEHLNDKECEFVAQCADLAYRARRGSLILEPQIAGVIYGDLVACSACEKVYPIWITEERKKYAWVACAHGLKYGGMLVRAARPAGAIDDITVERRRRSGYTAERWHAARS